MSVRKWVLSHFPLQKKFLVNVLNVPLLKLYPSFTFRNSGTYAANSNATLFFIHRVLLYKTRTDLHVGTRRSMVTRGRIAKQKLPR